MVTVQSFKNFIPLILLLYIAVGDFFLPSPLGDMSRTTRTTINGFLLGLFPQEEINNPYNHQRRNVESCNKTLHFSL